MVIKLMGFDIDMIYKSGITNRAEDALSTKGEVEIAFGALVSSSWVDWTEVIAEVYKDKFLSLLKEDIMQGHKEIMDFIVEVGRLLFKQRIVVPRNLKFITILLKEYHDSPVGGDSGDPKTYLRLAADWYWSGMRK